METTVPARPPTARERRGHSLEILRRLETDRDGLMEARGLLLAHGYARGPGWEVIESAVRQNTANTLTELRSLSATLCTLISQEWERADSTDALIAELRDAHDGFTALAPTAEAAMGERG